MKKMVRYRMDILTPKKHLKLSNEWNLKHSYVTGEGNKFALLFTDEEAKPEEKTAAIGFRVEE